MKFNKKIFLNIIIVLFVFGLGVLGSFFYFKKTNKPVEVYSQEEDKYMAFVDEIYTLIEENYWNKIPQPDLNLLFVKATEKLIGQVQPGQFNTKEELFGFIEERLDYWDEEEKKKEYVTQMADIVLANLEPFGRSRLYTQKDQQDLANTVQNKNPEKDRYSDLGLTKEASQEEIEQAYQALSEQWNPETNEATEAAQKYQAVQDAYKTLKDEQAREAYDNNGVESTMSYELINPSTLYIHMTKFSPTSLDDLQRITTKFQGKNGLDSLILDLSNNVGGAVDLLPYFLGPFIGNDQYAYQFFHQGEKEDYKTRIGWLPSLIQYKKVVVLINGNVQSSAEVFASTLKKYNVGVLVGTTTKGWGTVERVFPIERQLVDSETYSAFLVHSLTVREDGKMIQDNGVDPAISVTSAGWKEELMSYYGDSDLVSATEKAWGYNN